MTTPCRISIEQQADNRWRVWCVCGWLIDNTTRFYATPKGAFDTAYQHYTRVPHSGFMFIDLRRNEP